MEISVKAYAKLNLSLDIISRMENGYHNMRMVLQSANLCDDINIASVKGGDINIRLDLSYLPCDRRNIAVQAAEAFFEYTGISGYGLNINIKKRIPVCAGLGGGSADGAAVLRALNNMFDTGLDCKTLETIGGKLGSDVPFCIAGGTVLAEGRGDVLTNQPPLPECHIVICKPRFSVSTPELFSRIDCKKIKCRPDTDGILSALQNNCLSDVSRRMYNVFETVLPRGAATINDIKSKLLDYNALGAVMTGTGSAVFGLFDDCEQARCTYNVLKRSYRDCFLTKTKGRLDIKAE